MRDTKADSWRRCVAGRPDKRELVAFWFVTVAIVVVIRSRFFPQFDEIALSVFVDSSDETAEDEDFVAVGPTIMIATR